MQYFEKVCIFLLFAKMFLGLCPSEKYEQYLNGLVELIALAILLIPILHLSQEKLSIGEVQREWEEFKSKSFEHSLGEIVLGQEDYESMIIESVRGLQQEKLEKIEPEKKEQKVE